MQIKTKLYIFTAQSLQIKQTVRYTTRTSCKEFFLSQYILGEDGTKTTLAL